MLEARNLGKFYSGIPAVKDVTFTVARGQVLGLLGPNGSGKSTTVSMLTSLLEPTTGQVLFNGRPINLDPLDYNALRVRRHRGVAVAVEPEDVDEGVDLLLEDLRAEPAQLPDELEVFRPCQVGVEVRFFRDVADSGRQKILMSAALLHDPDLVVLDEPNSGLDVTSTLILRSLVQELADAGKIIGYSSHVLEMVEKVATDVLILHDSRVVAHDSVARLRDLLALPSLEQVFRKVVSATDVDQVARDIVGVMRL